MRGITLIVVLIFPGGWSQEEVGCYQKSSSFVKSTPGNCITTCGQTSYRLAGLGAVECFCAKDLEYIQNVGDCKSCDNNPFLKCGFNSSLFFYDTGFRGPVAPQDLECLHSTENALKISWKAFSVGGQQTGFLIKAVPLFTYSHNRVVEQSWDIEKPQVTESFLIGLTAATKYNVSVAAKGPGGSSRLIWKEMWTKISIPDIPQAPSVLWQDGDKMKVSITPSGNSKGPITAYRLAVIDDNQIPFFNKDNPVTWNQSQELGFPYYISAQFSEQTVPPEFVIGAGQTVGGYFNGPLPSKGHWHPILVIISSMDGYNLSSFSASSHHQHSDIHDVGERTVVADGGVVFALWVSIGVATAVLIICVLLLLLVRLKMLVKKPVRETHQLRLTRENGSSFSGSPVDDCLDPTGGYSHPCFVLDEPQWKLSCMDRLKVVNYMNRQEVSLPGDSENVRHTGNGKFGPVYKSLWKDKVISLYCLISLDEEGLFPELNALISLSPHSNLVQLLGFIEEGKVYLGIEFGGSSLKELLLKCRNLSIGFPSSSDLLLCAMGVAEALFHLHSFKVTHGSVAACNVLIHNGQFSQPKLTGFTVLSINPIKKEYDFSRWKAVELFHNRCISPSDSWSFGILLWEVCTLGATPYSEVRPEDLKARMSRGARPQQLNTMSDAVYQIMLHCWQIDRDERPDAGTLACSLHELLPHAQDHLVLSTSSNYPQYLELYENIN